MRKKHNSLVLPLNHLFCYYKYVYTYLPYDTKMHNILQTCKLQEDSVQFRKDQMKGNIHNLSQTDKKTYGIMKIVSYISANKTNVNIFYKNNVKTF